jgi:hypothetical protein
VKSLNLQAFLEYSQEPNNTVNHRDNLNLNVSVTLKLTFRFI